MEVVYKDSSPGYPPHLCQHTHAVIVGEMMKEERCHHDVEGRSAKRQSQRIPADRHGALCQSQTSKVQIECDNAARLSLEQRFAHIASTGGNIKHKEVRSLRQEPLDRPYTAEPFVDDFQFMVCRLKLLFRPA